MSTKSEIEKARLDEELRFEAMKHPDPQGYYRQVKNRNTGLGLIVASPAGLLFGGVGMAAMIALGIVYLVGSKNRPQ